MKKAIIGLLTLVFMISGLCFFGSDSNEVLAAAGDVTTGDGYIAVEYDDLTTYRTEEGNVAPTAPAAYADYIFAGWYQDATCDTAYKDVTADASLAYAKFVPANVLSVKAQLKEDTTSSSETTNMRLVSSVDGLRYENVGYEVYFNGAKTPVTVETETVYKRIVASAESGVDYNYSPKVVDVESEYFVTATLLNIKNSEIDSNFEKPFHIKPYWTTLDGTVVYGVSKYVTVNNGISKTNINISVKASAALSNDSLTVTVGGTTTYPATAAYYDGTYAHLNIDVANRDSVLKSLSVVTVKDGTTDVTTEYRNLMTKYDGTTDSADISWYDVYGTKAGKYVIATSADLYGLAKLINTPTYYFEDQTIYMIADIEVNKGRATATAWSTTDEGGNTIQDATSTPYTWTPIGSSSVDTLLGTLDGQGHTISGLVSTDDSDYKGMFQYTGSSTIISNFRLTNSLFQDNGFTGSIVGLSYGGEINSVYSDAFVTSTSTVNGGLVGGHWGKNVLTISNSCYAGTITAKKYTGGLLGKQHQSTGEAVIENCLFSGTISFSGIGADVQIGGFVGNVVKKLTISNSLNTGQLKQEDSYNVTSIGRITGKNDTAATVDVENVYYTNIGSAGTITWNQLGSVAEGSEEPVMLEESDITGNLAYFNKILDYSDTGAWAVVIAEHAKDGVTVIDSTPVLKDFADIAGVEVKLPTIPEGTDIDWYNGLEVDAHTVCNNADDSDANKAELYGFAYLVNEGIDFDEMTVSMLNDVTVNEGTVDTWNTSTGEGLTAWTPIGTTAKEFAGIFDGGMNSISGIYLNTTEVGAGLFRGTAEGSAIQNLKLENSYINSTNSNTYAVVGSVVAACSGSLSNIYSDAVVKASQSLAGGIVGQMHGDNTMSVDNCWFDGNVTAKGTCGGIVAAVSTGVVTMDNCLNTGAVSGTANSVGGLCGRTFRSTEKYNLSDEATTLLGLQMSNCLNAGKVTCATWTGSVIGGIQHITNSTMSVSNVYATNESYVVNDVPTWCGRNKTSDGTAATAVTESSITGLLSHYNNILVSADAWVPTDEVPALKVFTDGLLTESTDDINIDWFTGLDALEYTICDEDTNEANVAELNGFAYISNHGIDFDGMTVTLANDVTVNEEVISELTDEERAGLVAWTPIATIEKPFAGTFEGGLHSISGLYATSSSNGLGLFAATAEGSKVQNLKLLNSYFKNTAFYTGSIVGKCVGNIENVYSDATVQGKHYNGGLVGYVPVASEKTVDIKKSWFDGDLKASGNQTGGIVGGIDGTGKLSIENCLNSGTLAGTEGKLTFAGGLCGHAIDTSVTINQCLNVGIVDGGTATDKVGSIFGNKNSTAVVTVTDTYTTDESYQYKEEAKAFGVTTIAGTGCCICSVSDITGNMGYYNIDFARGDVWAITAATPELEAFSTAKVNDPAHEGKNIDWYTGLIDSTFTICAEEDENATKVEKLYGFAFLVDQGIKFAGKTVNLGQDVVVNEGTAYSDWDTENGTYNETALITWDPIGAEGKVFAGTFNGNNKTISGLYTKGTTFLGLFARVDATGMIQNIKLEDSYFEGTGSMGSIAGRLDGNIDTVYSNADITSSGANNGGIVGQKNSNTTSTITNCCYAGTVNMGTAAVNTGGILGKQINGDLTLQDCLFTGDIKVDSEKNRTANIGGFVGQACKKLTINTSLSSGSTTNDSGYTIYATCPVIGQIVNDEGVIITCDSVYYIEDGYTTTNAWYRPYEPVDEEKKYYSTVEGMDPVLIDGAGADIAGTKAFYYTNLDFEAEKGWALVTEAVNGADGTPVLRSFADANAVPTLPEVPENTDIKWFKGLGVNTYTICNSEEDNAANVKELYGFEHLVNDIGIDFSGKTVSMLHDVTVNEGWTATETPEATPTNIWTPIGTDTMPFAGTFDGNGNTIDGLYVDGSHDFMGFFATTGYYSTIKDFRIVNSYINQQITGDETVGYTGSVVGELRGKMSGVYSNAIVKSGNHCIGGLAARVKTNSGFSTTIDISNCWFDGTVIGGEAGRYIGGIVGTAVRGTCNIENVLFTGTINSDFTSLEKSVYIGGIVADGKANGLTLNLTSVVSAGHIVGDHNYGIVHSVIGRVRTGENQSPKLKFSNVFATRDCCETTYSVGPTEDEDGNPLTAVEVTGSVLQTTGDDRLIGYISQNMITGKDAETEENIVANMSLDFTNNWSMRTDGVPVPTSLKDMATNVISSPDEAAMASEIGLTYWNSEATIKDVKASGGGNYLVSYPVSNALTYDEYIEILGTAVGETTASGNAGLGFTLYASNSGKDSVASDMNADGIYTSTYYKEATATTGEWVLNITYVEKESTIYISINTDLDSRDDNMVSAVQEESNTISLSMLEMVNTHDGNNPYGNSFVFQLPNGHFIVNDGGRAEDGEKLLVYLKDQAGTTDGIQNPVYIDAWIISHYHDDHCGALGGFYDDGDLDTYDVLSGSTLRDDIYLKAVYACEPNSYALDYWDTQLGVMNKALKGAMTLTQEPVEDGETPKRPDVYQLHMGQRYYFNGITMDVIDTQEQHTLDTWGKDSEENDLPDAFNTSSTNCLFTFKDASNVAKKVLIGGDATTVNMEYIMKVYGTDNETLSNVDVIAAYHHGHNTTATFADGTVTTTYESSSVTADIKATANYDWANFLLHNNDDSKFDAVLFPFNQIYEMHVEYTGSALLGGRNYYYIGADRNVDYPYNIGEINNYMVEHASKAYTYENGTVKITFDGSNTTKVFGTGIFTTE